MVKKKVVLDTNMLLYIGEHNLNIFSELERVCDFPYKVYVLEGTIRELEKLINKGSLSERRFASLSLRIIKKKGVGIIKSVTGKSVDEMLTKLPPKTTIVVTQDKALKKFLKNKKIKVLTLKQKKILIFEE